VVAVVSGAWDVQRWLWATSYGPGLNRRHRRRRWPPATPPHAAQWPGPQVRADRV